MSSFIPSHRVALRLSPRALALVRGDFDVDEELRPLMVRKPVEPCAVDTLMIHGTALAQARSCIARQSGFTLVIGLTGTGRRSLLQAVAKEQCREMLAIDARHVSTDKAVFVRDCRAINVTPHIAQTRDTRRRSAIDDRTTRHAGYLVSQRKRKLVEEIFGRMNTFGGFHRTRFKGRRRTQLAGTIVAAAYNLLRICRLLPRTA